jgi:predicted alpha-1,2-mannosidase
MISRRRFLSGAAAAAAVCGTRKSRAAAKVFTPAGVDAATDDLTKFVKIKIGTGGHGHTYPGASVPFGMVQLSPDTYNKGWDWCSGYNYSDSSIMGFSHTHLSGTGIGDMLDILLMPCTGAVKLEPGDREHPEEGYRSRFSHDDEVAVPGYYSVLLQDYKIQAELSATARAGIHRYRFPEDPTSHIVFDFAHGYAQGPGSVRWAKLKVVGNDTITGGRATARWANGREIYFAMKFSRPFEGLDVFADGAKLETLPAEIDGKSLKCVLHYPTKSGEVILVKTGISGVSAEGALRNLETEIPAWDFEQIRSHAHVLWEQELAKIKVEGGTQKQKEIFYTSLYHTLLAPTLFDDVDGSYRGMDGEVHQLTAGAHNYSTFSLWDTYRALHPLFTLTQQQRVPDLANCLIRMSHESPVGMPVWPLQSKETKCMTGYHSAVVIAEAVGKGFPGIDVAAAWTSMKKQVTVSDYRGLPLYRQYGYIPCDLDSESIGKSMDYAYNDWAVAHIAKVAGDEQEAVTLLTRALSYRNLYDKNTGFIRPRLQSGDWAEPFAPNEMGHFKKWRDFTESNAWQATFAVQHDPLGLATLMGGRDKLLEKLDGLFNASSEQPPDAPDDIAGLVGQYAHGDEPSHHIAYLYLYAGAPHKTQERVWSLMETMYNNEPDGLAGNEDCGQMSAWYVMSAMGIYAVDPVSANYVFGTPLFDKVTVEIGDGKRLVLEAKRSSPSDKYIGAVRFNGKTRKQLWFRHSEITKGGRFELAMTAAPNMQLGVAVGDAPPSMSSV